MSAPTCKHPGCELDMGHHMVADWIEHNSDPHFLGYEEAPGDPVPMLTGPDGMPVTDTITAAGAQVNIPGLAVGAVVLDLGYGRPGHPPERVWRGMFVGTPQVLRQAGRLLNDACNHAAHLAQPPRSSRR